MTKFAPSPLPDLVLGAPAATISAYSSSSTSKPPPSTRTSCAGSAASTSASGSSYVSSATQHGQRRAVVAHVEAALADLPERHQGQRGHARRRAGRRAARSLADRADQHLDGVVVAAGRAAAQQGEGRAVVGEQPADEVMACAVRAWRVFDGSSARRIRGGTAPETPKAAPRAAFAMCCRTRESVGRRMSGPPPVLDRDLDLLRRHAPTLADVPGIGAGVSTC